MPAAGAVCPSPAEGITVSEETTTTEPRTAWERNASIVVTVPGATADTVTVAYRVLLAALALADIPHYAGVAQTAIEENARAEGFEVDASVGGSSWPGHRFRLDPTELERAVWLARYFRGETEDAS
jgi:hypothetical protein